MKRLLIVTAVIAVVLAGLYLWSQQRATVLMTKKVRQIAAPTVANPEELTVRNSPVEIRGPRAYHMDTMEIAGDGLIVSDAVTLDSARIVLHDVDISGQPPKPTHVGSATFDITIADVELTRLVRQQKPPKVEGMALPLDTILITCTRAKGVTIAGELAPPLLRPLAFTITGNFAPAGEGLAFHADRVSIPGLPMLESRIPRTLPITASLGELFGSSFNGTLTDISAEDGLLRLRGTLPVDTLPSASPPAR